MTAATTGRTSSPPGGRGGPGRLALAGAVLIAAALGLVRTPWAWEYRLQKMDLELLSLLAQERPHDPLVRYYLGTGLYNAGQLPEAASSLQRAWQLQPASARIALALGLTYLAGGRTLQAHEVLGRAAELAPDSPDIHFALGTLYYHQFDSAYTRAGDAFQHVCRRQPWNADAWFYLGICREAMGDYNRSIEALGEAVRLRPYSARALREMAFVLIQDAKYERAAPFIERALQVDPDDSISHYVLAHLAIRRSREARDLEIAEREARRAIELGFVSAEPFEVLGEVAFRRQQYERAAACYQLCLTLTPRYEEAIYRLSQVHQRLGNQDEAQRYIDRYQQLRALVSGLRNTIDRIKLKPDDPELRLRLARLFVQDGDDARALNQYEYCLHLQPDHEAARRELEDLRRRVGDQVRSPSPTQAYEEEAILRLPGTP